MGSDIASARGIDDDLRQRAVRLYQTQIRYRTMVQSVVARALDRHGPIDPEDATRAAHDIATDAAAVLLEMIYENDAELHRLRAEMEAYRKFAEESVGLRPMPPFLVPAPR